MLIVFLWIDDCQERPVHPAKTISDEQCVCILRFYFVSLRRDFAVVDLCSDTRKTESSPKDSLLRSIGCRRISDNRFLLWVFFDPCILCQSGVFGRNHSRGVGHGVGKCCFCSLYFACAAGPSPGLFSFFLARSAECTAIEATGKQPPDKSVT